MKIVAISDTLGLHWSLKTSQGDILVHAGADNLTKNKTKKPPIWAVFVLSRTF